MSRSISVQQEVRENLARTSWECHRSDTPSVPDWRSWQPDAISYTHRHWHPRSEAYAGVDCLLSALDEGWNIDGIVFGEVHRFGDGRQTTVYHFAVTRNDATMVMPIIEYPCVARLIAALTIQVILVSDR